VEALMKLNRDKAEKENANWTVGYFRWILTANCGNCGCPSTAKITGTKEDVLRCVDEKRWRCVICERDGK